MLIKTLADILRETLDVDCDEVWKNERTLALVRMFGVCLRLIELSLREVIAVLELLGVDRSYEAVWNWTHDLAESQSDPTTAPPSRIEVNETQIEATGGRNG